MKFVKSRGKRTLEKVRNANEKLRETRRWRNYEERRWNRSFWKGQVAKCRSIEELYVLWELMQQMEEDPFGNTCYPELDQRNFHVDGIADPEHYDGTLYILKETNMRKMIQKGETMPVASDIRADFLSGKVPPAGWNIWIISQACRRSCGRKKHPGEECRLPGKKLREKGSSPLYQ